jgi:hypothetical protein
MTEMLSRKSLTRMANIEYFTFEQDFVEKDVRCIPMIVRFKMDAAGIKLKLAEWSLFGVQERIELALRSCDTNAEARSYNTYLAALVKKYTGEEATPLEIDKNPEWGILYKVPSQVYERALSCGFTITPCQWSGLSNLQRFALLKLCRPGHESKNFIKALKEFGLEEAGALFVKQ